MNILVAYEVTCILVIGLSVIFIVHGHFGVSVSSVGRVAFRMVAVFVAASRCSECVCAVGHYVICCMCA